MEDKERSTEEYNKWRINTHLSDCRRFLEKFEALASARTPLGTEERENAAKLTGLIKESEELVEHVKAHRKNVLKGIFAILLNAFVIAATIETYPLITLVGLGILVWIVVGGIRGLRDFRKDMQRLENSILLLKEIGRKLCEVYGQELFAEENIMSILTPPGQPPKKWGTKWLKLYVYVRFPIFIVWGLYTTIQGIAAVFDFYSPALVILVAVDVMYCIFHCVTFAYMLSMSERGYRLNNWLIIITCVYNSVTNGIFDSAGNPVISIFVNACFGILIWVWPNLVYFRHRKHLFTDKKPAAVKESPALNAPEN